MYKIILYLRTETDKWDEKCSVWGCLFSFCNAFSLLLSPCQGVFFFKSWNRNFLFLTQCYTRQVKCVGSHRCKISCPFLKPDVIFCCHMLLWYYLPVYSTNKKSLTHNILYRKPQVFCDNFCIQRSHVTLASSCLFQGAEPDIFCFFTKLDYNFVIFVFSLAMNFALANFAFMVRFFWKKMEV